MKNELEKGDKVWFFRTDRFRGNGDYTVVDITGLVLDYSIIKSFDIEKGCIYLEGWETDEFWSFHLYLNRNDALRALNNKIEDILNDK